MFTVDKLPLKLDRHKTVTMFTGQWQVGEVDVIPKGVQADDDGKDAEEEAEVHCKGHTQSQQQ